MIENIEDLYDVLNDMDNYTDDNTGYTLDKISHLEHLEDLKDALYSKLYNYIHKIIKYTPEDLNTLFNELNSLRFEIERLQDENNI